MIDLISKILLLLQRILAFLLFLHTQGQIPIVELQKNAKLSKKF